ncbi:hypothetical protein BVX99_02240 [bacterium F16]|nr:hypothetical protein BVX99_02240 [bacterium F16]
MDLEHYFSDAIPDDDRFHNMHSFSQGAWLGVFCLLERLKSYYDLLELELEDNPAGAIYMKESQTALKCGEALLDCARRCLAVSSCDSESFDLLVMLQGIARRLHQITLAELTITSTKLPHEHAFIRGRQYLLQQVLFEIPRLLGIQEGSSQALNVEVSELDFDDFFVESKKSSLSPGSYFVCNFTGGNQLESLDDAMPLMQTLFTSRTLKLNERLVFLCGILLEHGGDIFLTTQDSGITAVTLAMPTQQSESNMFREDSFDEAQLKGTETVLLVDDEGSIWDVVIDMLQKLGYTVILAENGLDCVEIYKENADQIDLILLDMVMPQMNGHDAFFKLKEIDPEVKVLVQSGYIQQKEAQDVLNSGALGFLQKPYRMQELAAKIRSIFG